MKTCKVCPRDSLHSEFNEADESICCICGETLKERPLECPFCKAKLNTKHHFCPGCGRPVE